MEKDKFIIFNNNEEKGVFMSRLSVSVCMIFGFSMFTFAGCASKPTTADLMRGHSADEQVQVDLKNQLAKDWDRGRKLIASGNKKIKSGEKSVASAEKDLKDAKDQVETGNRELTEGTQLVQISEARFRESFPNLELNLGK